MSSSSVRRVLVVAGLGNGSGTGAATARLFSKAGYTVALVARGADVVKQLAEELNTSGGEATPFPVDSYSSENIKSVWGSIRAQYPQPGYVIRTAIFNIGHSVFKPFLDVTPQDIQDSLQVNVAAGFAFSREAILTFKGNDIEEPVGKRGTLIFTGATASLRGNVVTSAFAAGKHGLRALSQSLAKEFSKDNIHVAHSIIDGAIATDAARAKVVADWINDPNKRLNADSIANSYLFLVNQDRSAWTWEIDLRPAHEKW